MLNSRRTPARRNNDTGGYRRELCPDCGKYWTLARSEIGSAACMHVSIGWLEAKIDSWTLVWNAKGNDRLAAMMSQEVMVILTWTLHYIVSRKAAIEY